MANSKILVYSLSILILTIGCDNSYADISPPDEYPKYANWENWIRSQVMQIHFDTDKCIKRCDVDHDGCYGFSCYSDCSVMHDREITSLAHKAFSEGMKIKDEIISANIEKYNAYIPGNDDSFISSIGNELIFDMAENDKNEKPMQYIGCLVGCGDGNCFKSSCINKCVSILG